MWGRCSCVDSAQGFGRSALLKWRSVHVGKRGTSRLSIGALDLERRISVDSGSYHGQRGVRLTDEASGASALVLPEFGANCVEFYVQREQKRLDILSPPDLTKLSASGTGGGVPILCPFPNRIRDARFPFRGREIQLHANRAGNAIHGLVHTRAWEVRDQWVDSEGAAVTCGFRSSEHDSSAAWPWPFEATITYRLRGERLDIEATVENLSDDVMPLGFGTHPYFVIGDRHQCEIQIPAAARWETAGDEPLPTGRILDLPHELDFRSLRPLGELALDDVFTAVEFDGDGSACRLLDRARGIALTCGADRQFREWVVFTPPGSSFVCFEPYTCPTDAFNLAAQGIDAGVIELQPGQRFVGKMWFVVESIA